MKGIVEYSIKDGSNENEFIITCFSFFCMSPISDIILCAKKEMDEEEDKQYYDHAILEVGVFVILCLLHAVEMLWRSVLG